MFSEKKKQTDYKPGSVVGATCAAQRPPIIYPHAPSLMRSIVLPSDADSRMNHSSEPPLKNWRQFTRTFSLRDAQPACRHTAGGLLPHLLTLTYSARIKVERCQSGGCFLLHSPNLHKLLPIKKRSALCCPDFPPAPLILYSDARDRPSVCFDLLKSSAKL